MENETSESITGVGTPAEEAEHGGQDETAQDVVIKSNINPPFLSAFLKASQFPMPSQQPAFSIITISKSFCVYTKSSDQPFPTDRALMRSPDSSIIQPVLVPLRLITILSLSRISELSNPIMAELGQGESLLGSSPLLLTIVWYSKLLNDLRRFPLGLLGSNARVPSHQQSDDVFQNYALVRMGFQLRYDGTNASEWIFTIGLDLQASRRLVGAIFLGNFCCEAGPDVDHLSRFGPKTLM
ncbi:unnamed protein product [Protopolystoma xenopodis]|uniref:Uncharacterized protein n=1 Tax=Protopolystoma xenopodis TaxID=117903 RepID=A0A448WFV2_9PLAT|nr:unnamed protein product [Protopolystoma xenopodis]